MLTAEVFSVSTSASAEIIDFNTLRDQPHLANSKIGSLLQKAMMDFYLEVKNEILGK